MRDLGMTTVESFDLTADDAWLASVARGSLVVAAAGLALDVALAAGGHMEAVGVPWLAAVVLVSAVALPVHELVHGAAFKLLGGRDLRLRFGYMSPGMLYTCADGAVLPRRSFVAVLLAPAVLLSAGFLAGGALLGVPLAGATCLWIHLSGCTGDLVMARRVVAAEAPYVRDTARGYDLVAPGPAPSSGPAVPGPAPAGEGDR